MNVISVSLDSVVHTNVMTDVYYVNLGGKLFRGKFNLWFDLQTMQRLLKPKNELQEVKYLINCTKVPKEVCEEFKIPVIHGRKVKLIKAGIPLEEVCVDRRRKR